MTLPAKTRRRPALLAALLALAACTVVPPGPVSQPGGGTLKRIVNLPRGTEVTGLALVGGDLYFNTPHPSSRVTGPFANATIGVVSQADFAAPAVAVSRGAERNIVTTSLGSYTALMRSGEYGRVGVVPGHDKASQRPDFNGVLPTGRDSALLFTNWEERPGGMSRAKLTRGPDGVWQVRPESIEMVNFRPVGGTWVNCFGAMSPWNTPLSAEELYFPNTHLWNSTGVTTLMGIDRLAGWLGHFPNPYRYGYIVEITDPAGAAVPVKRVAMGRFSHENAAVMPDQRTVYLSDDGSGTVLFKFVADRARDLSAGTLYAAKASQRTADGADPAASPLDITWVKLAHASQAQIERWIATYDGVGRDGAYITDAEIAAWAAGRAPDDRVAFLESRKAAAAKGASAEFTKMEGIGVNFRAIAGGDRAAYVAMTRIGGPMSDGEGDIRLAENRCGVVYRLALGADWSATALEPTVVGSPAGGRCSTESIANPDNIVVDDSGRVLIGEDGRHHPVNMIWLWTPPT